MKKQNKDWEEDIKILGMMRLDDDNFRLYETKKLIKFVGALIKEKEKGIKISLFNSLINWAKKERQDYLWVGEKGCDMSYAYNLALEELIMYLKKKLKETKK